MVPTEVAGGRQLDLPLSRDERLALVEAFGRRPFAALSNTMRDNLAELLRQVELSTRADGARLAQDVLAAKCRVDVRTVRRWVRIACEWELLAVEEGGGRELSYVVHWDRVRRLGQTSRPETGGQALQDLTRRAHDPDAERTGREGRPPDENVRSDRTIVRSDRTIVRGPPINPLGGLNQTPINPIKPHCANSPPFAKRVLSGQTGHFSAGVSSPDFFALSLEVLGDPRRLDEWFGFAVERHGLREVDRLRVFTAARSVVRRARRAVDPLTNPAGAFWRIVKRRLWGAASQADEAWARLALRELDLANG